jgi:hypothetical protein
MSVLDLLVRRSFGVSMRLLIVSTSQMEVLTICGDGSHLTAPVNLRERPGQLSLSGRLLGLRVLATSATIRAPSVSLQ